MDYSIYVIPAVEVLFIAVMINYLLSFFWNARSMDLVLGFFAFLLIFAASAYLNLPVVHKLMQMSAGIAVIAILIIFQPELRVALSRLSFKGKRYREITEFDKFLDQLANSVYKLAEYKIGALIVLENEDNLDEYARKGIMLNAMFSSELLESIFGSKSPLHDGAVIIRDTTIVSAVTILPLAEDVSQLTKSMGTRHRAGLGASQITDSMVIIASEETGKVSIARDGIMRQGVKIDRFKGVLRSLFNPPAKKSISSNSFWGWVKR